MDDSPKMVRPSWECRFFRPLDTGTVRRMGETQSSGSPLAFLYDRHVTVACAELDRRLDECRRHLARQGWTWGGEWIDEGDSALTADHRPEFEALLLAIATAGPDRPRVCLVHGWDRLSRDPAARTLMCHQVLLLGGRVETCDGDRAPGDRSSAGPVTA